MIFDLCEREPNFAAWYEFGTSEWGREGSADVAFLHVKTSNQIANAIDFLRKYYTPQTKLFVEEFCAEDWKHFRFHFDSFHLSNYSSHLRLNDASFRNKIQHCLNSLVSMRERLSQKHCLALHKFSWGSFYSEDLNVNSREMNNNHRIQELSSDTCPTTRSKK